MTPQNFAFDLPEVGKREELVRISSFMRSASLQVTRPSFKDLDDLKAVLRPGTPVYLTVRHGCALEEMIATARHTRESGLEPVPHVAARFFSSTTEIARLVSSLVRVADVSQIMLIGGDFSRSGGGSLDALRVIQSGALEGSGLHGLGLSAFPDGHPMLSADELELALVTKTAAAQSAGLSAHLVTQFCSDFRPVARWLAWLRGRGVQIPVRIGFAGPTTLMGWLKFARLCGVRASPESLAARSGLARHAFKTIAPDSLVRAAAAMHGALGSVDPHLFAFGGAGATARWASSAALGKISLTREGGFDPTEA